MLITWQAVRATRAERAEARQRLRAERRFQATVKMMSNGFWTVTPYFSDLIGGAKPREELALATMDLISELQQDVDPSPEFRRALGRLYFETAGIQAWWGGNTMGDYEGGLNSALKAIELLTPPDPSKVDNNTLDTVARTYMLAGFAARGLLRNEDAIIYFREMEKWATYMMTFSTNQESADLGATVQGWAQGCVANILLETGRAEEVLTNWFLPRLERVQARTVDTNTAPEEVLFELGSFNMTARDVILSFAVLASGVPILFAESPAILFPPKNETVVLYQQSTLGVIVGGTPPLFYQWFKDGVAITGATNDQVVIALSRFSDAGEYSVTASNTEGTVTSSTARLTVNPPKAGDLDGSFAYGGSINGPIRAVAIQPNGKILIGGEFTTVHDAVRGGIARLNSDCTTDHTFMHGLPGIRGDFCFVDAVALQRDGKVIIAGVFAEVNGVRRPNLARLNGMAPWMTAFPRLWTALVRNG